MPSPILNVAVARAAERLPVLKRIPLARLVIAAEVAFLAKAHYERLTPSERRSLVMLLRQARLQPSNLSSRDRAKLEKLVNKLEPKLFAKSAAQKLSPVALKRKA